MAGVMHRRDFLSHAAAGAAGLTGLSGLSGCAPLAPWQSGQDTLPHGTPEAQGIPSDAVRDFLDAVALKGYELHGFVLMRHGRVVAQGWWKPYGPQFVHSLYSMSKSFTSAAVGFAVAERRLSVEDRVLKFFPDDLPAQVSDHLAAMRVRDLLTMSTGQASEPTWEMLREGHWARQFLALPVTRAPGSVFRYSSAATYMCSAIVQRLTGQRLVDYLRPRLFEPLGITQVHWETCPQGIDVGGSGLHLQTQSLARFGQLCLQDGRWNGRQVLPAGWVAEATARQIQQTLPAQPRRPHERNDWVQGYGYQFWRCTHGAYRGDGAFGQFTVVMPQQDAVLAITGECNDMQGELDLVWQHLLPAMKTALLPADPAAQARLRQTIDALALPLPQGAASSPAARRVSGRTFALERNALGLESVSFAFDGDAVRLGFRDARQSHVLVGRIGAWQRGDTALPGMPPRLSPAGAPPSGTLHPYVGAGAWTDEATFELLLRFLETAHHDRLSVRFSGAQVEIGLLGSIAAMAPKPIDARGMLRGTLV